MKLSTIITTLFIAAALLISCSSTSDSPEVPDTPDVTDGLNAIVPPSATFPAKDDSRAPGSNPAQLVADLLTKTGTEIIKGMGYVQINQQD